MILHQVCVLEWVFTLKFTFLILQCFPNKSIPIFGHYDITRVPSLEYRVQINKTVVSGDDVTDCMDGSDEQDCSKWVYYVKQVT